MPFDITYHGTIARWLPKDPAIIRQDLATLLAHAIKNGACTKAGHVDENHLSLVILEFKNLIEEDADIFRDFHEMFEQVSVNQLSVSSPGYEWCSPH